jgi:hypothetical protein
VISKIEPLPQYDLFSYSLPTPLKMTLKENPVR